MQGTHAPTPCPGSGEFARPPAPSPQNLLFPLSPLLPDPRAAEEEGRDRQGLPGAEAAGQVAGLRLPWEGIACVRRAARASGQRASAHRPERGDWNVKRKRVHGNSKLSPDEKQRGERFFGK